ncbi:DUF4393 domain-containing protein [Dolosigranulum pigrum]|uniref:DUF4393 domain-containing protein n=1 Tax=Dolosigranulum pigrum TaxID=29394 RepID=UPI001AD854FC|nr:DUF4393 domain-containing protein [Dolosigranulum pigrum]QTJ33526.1 DUF4393 domain-containing protein [Dolosigranulum pigrum]
MNDFLMTTLGGVVGGLSVKAFSGPLKTLEDAWFLAVGHKFENKKSKLQAKIDADYERLKYDMLKNIHHTPADRIKDPNMQIVGPALEAAKYSISNETLRQMFAKLISSSMDTDKNEIIHPAFVDVLKQLSPFDAQVLQAIYNGNEAVAKILFGTDNHSFKEMATNVYIDESLPNNDHKLISSSLDNLNRLGIINIDYNQNLSDLSQYDPIKESITYQKLKLTLEALKDVDGFSVYTSIEFRKGICRLTQFGQDFSFICLDSDGDYSS